jgi:hypothetical protein
MVASLEEFEGTVAYLQHLTEIELASLNSLETVLTAAGGLCNPFLGSPPAVCATITGATGVNQRLIGYGGSFHFCSERVSLTEFVPASRLFSFPFSGQASGFLRK